MNHDLTAVAEATGVYEGPIPLTEWVAMALFTVTLILFVIGMGVWA